MGIDQFSYWIGIAATVAFSVTAVLAIYDRGVDLFGAITLGFITAVGGGTIRDIILDVPVFWSIDLSYVWVGVGSSVAAFFARPLFARRHIYSLLLYLDGFGAALFAVQGAHKTLDLQFGIPLAPIILGVVTGIGGGLIRDLLAGRSTLIMSRDIYAVPLLLGSTLYVILAKMLPGYMTINGTICITATFALRAAAIHWNLQVPRWLLTASEEPSRGPR